MNSSQNTTGIQSPKCGGCSGRFRFLQNGQLCGRCQSQMERDGGLPPIDQNSQCSSCGHDYPYLKKRECHDCETFAQGTSAAMSQAMSQPQNVRNLVLPVIPAAGVTGTGAATQPGYHDPVLVARASEVTNSLQESRRRDVALSKEFKRPIGKPKLNSGGNVGGSRMMMPPPQLPQPPIPTFNQAHPPTQPQSGSTVPNAGRLEVKLVKVSNRKNARGHTHPVFDAVMRPYVLDTPWTTVREDLLQDIDEAYTTNYNVRMLDQSKVTFYLNGSKTKVPDEYEHWTLRSMWNDLIKSSSIRPAKRQDMVLELFAIADYWNGVADPSDLALGAGETEVDTGLSSATQGLAPTAVKRQREDDPGRPAVFHRRQKGYMTSFQVKGSFLIAARTDCEIANGTVVWSTSPEPLTVLLHAEILASGVTKHARIIGNESYVAKTFYNLSSNITRDGKGPLADPIQARIPHEVNLRHLQDELRRQKTASLFLTDFIEFAQAKRVGIYDLTVLPSFILTVCEGHEKGLSFLVDPLLSSTKVDKYSGTRQAGNNTNLVGMTCDAYAHYCAFESNLGLVPVDIQGVLCPRVRADGRRGSKALHLFDLMFHSADKSYGLGDAGMEGIKQFFTQHKCNTLCTALGLPIGKGCDGASLDDVHISVIIGAGAPGMVGGIDNDGEVQERESVGLAQSRSISGSVVFDAKPPTRTMVYTPSALQSFALGDYMCHPVSLTPATGAPEDWTVLLEPGLQGLAPDSQDSAFYKRVALLAGVSGLLEEYVEKLSILLAMPHDIGEITLLSPSLVKPAEDDAQFTIGQNSYIMLTAVPLKLSSEMKVHKYGVTAPYISDPSEEYDVPAQLTELFNGFSHYIFSETLGEYVVTDFEYMVQGEVITILNFGNPVTLVESFRCEHRCNSFCAKLKLKAVY